MREGSGDIQVFRRLTAWATVVVAFVAGTAALAIRHDGSDHALGLVTSVCSAAIQVMGGVSALLLLSLPVLLVVSVVAHAWLMSHRTRSVTRRLLLARGPVPERLTRAAAQAGIAGRVDLVHCRQPEVFAYGLRAPRVLLTTGGLAALSDGELAAVMHHEAHHVRRRDPLRLTFAHSLGRALFMFPLVGDLSRQLGTATELEADRRAIRDAGRIELASALTRFLGAKRLAAAPGVSLQHADELRVAQLRRPERFAYSFTPRRSAQVVSLVAACMIVAQLVMLALAPDMA